VSLGVVFALDYADQSFRTPSEVLSELRIPVLAAVPVHRNGHNVLHAGDNGNSIGVEVRYDVTDKSDSISREQR